VDNPVWRQVTRAYVAGFVPGSAYKSAGTGHGFRQGKCNGILIGVRIGNSVPVGHGGESFHIVYFLVVGASGIQYLRLVFLADALQICGKHLHPLVNGGYIGVFQPPDGNSQIHRGILLVVRNLRGIDTEILQFRLAVSRALRYRLLSLFCTANQNHCRQQN